MFVFSNDKNCVKNTLNLQIKKLELMVFLRDKRDINISREIYQRKMLNKKEKNRGLNFRRNRFSRGRIRLIYRQFVRTNLWRIHSRKLHRLRPKSLF